MDNADEAPMQVYHVFVKASPEPLWEAIVSPALTARYFHGARITNSPSRHVSLGPDGSTWGDGPVFEWDPPRRLSHEWRSLYDEEMAAEQPSRVTWEIEPQEGGYCRLTLVHDQLEGAPKTAAGVDGPGWAFVLSGLKTMVETGQSLAAQPEQHQDSVRPASLDVGFAVDTYQLVLLSRGTKAGDLDEATIDRLGEAHLQHNLRQQAEGTLLAAGAVIGATATRNAVSDRPLVGLSLYDLPPSEVLRLKDQDPGVQAGLYTAELVQFMCPKGTLSFHTIAPAAAGDEAEKTPAERID